MIRQIFLYLVLFIRFSVDSESKVNSKVVTYENIGDTNLTTNIFYYIKEKSVKYLRWDGNTDSDWGLCFDPQLRNDYKKDWYVFELEISEDNKTLIRNYIYLKDLYMNLKV